MAKGEDERPCAGVAFARDDGLRPEEEGDRAPVAPCRGGDEAAFGDSDRAPFAPQMRPAQRA